MVVGEKPTLAGTLLESPSAVQEGLLAAPDRSLAAACDILVPRGERFQMERGMHEASLGCLDLKSAQSGEGMGMMEEPPPGIRG